MSPSTGAAVLARDLARLGVDRIFTLSGNQILSLYDACIDEHIALTDTRHEAAAVHMAEAWARLRGQPGVCLVSAGPGHLNALAALANAKFSETPVLLLSGGHHRAQTGRGSFQEIDQPAIAAPLTKFSRRVTDVGDLQQSLALAWKAMREGRPGPAHISLPADLLGLPVSMPPPPLDAATVRPETTTPDDDQIQQVLDHLTRAERPLVIAGPSAGNGEALVALQALATETGLPCLVADSPRGLSDPAWHRAGQHSRQADVVLLLAPQDVAVGFAGAAFDPNCFLIHVAPPNDPASVNRRPDLALVGDYATTLSRLATAAIGRPWPARSRADQPQARWVVTIGNTQRAARAELAPLEQGGARPPHPLRVAAAVRDALPAGTSVSIDGGEFSQWARWCFGAAECTMLVNGKFGMLGPAIPFAVAATLARPGVPAVAFVGDGTAGYHLMELDTAVRHDLPVIVVIGNDAQWSSEYHRQVKLYGPDRLVAAKLLPTRYDEVAKALGADGELITDPAEIGPAVQRALGRRRPTCLNVMISPVESPADPV